MNGKQMKNAGTIAALGIFAMGAWGQECSAPDPVFNPAVIPAGDTQPLELHGFQYTDLPLQTFVTASSLYSASGFPWAACRVQTLTRITGSGTFLSIAPSGSDYLVYETGITPGQGLTVVNQWSMQAANAQAPITGQQPLIDWDHEAIRLPNGWTAIIGSEEMMMTNAAQCPTAEYPTNYCDVVGDKIVVMDAGGTVEWVWDSFNPAQFPYLDRPAILGETCTPGTNNVKCPIALAPVAQDWLHANSLWYDPKDGNLVINLRNQDWIVKVAYQNGTGDGSVVWRLGNEGDFTMAATSIPSPWEDHPHDVTSPNPGVYSMFDNGNGRHALSEGTSRGLVYGIHEAAREVIGIHVYPVQVYSPSSGSAQLLTNGDWMFLAGRPEDAAGIYSEEFEFAPNTLVPLWTEQLPEQYRVIRLSKLFYY